MNNTNCRCRLYVVWEWKNRMVIIPYTFAGGFDLGNVELFSREFRKRGKMVTIPAEFPESKTPIIKLRVADALELLRAEIDRENPAVNWSLEVAKNELIRAGRKCYTEFADGYELWIYHYEY